MAALLMAKARIACVVALVGATLAGIGLLRPTAASAAGAAGTIGTVAGGGPFEATPALAAGMQPGGLLPGPGGVTYFSDGPNDVVYRMEANGLIARVAGNLSRGFSGDGGPATAAQLSFPAGLALDATGNLLIADSNNNRIRAVSPSGVISTIAGTGAQGFGAAGDGGQATSAQLALPTGLAVDAAGNIYVADTLDNRVRRIAPGGVISNFAGSSGGGFSGDGGQATLAQMSVPNSVALDPSGNVYVADRGNSRIRKVAGGIITTFAGNGQPHGGAGDGGPAVNAQLDGPGSVIADAAGTVYIADTNNARVRKVSGGIISAFAGTGSFGFSGDGGPATSATMSTVVTVVIDPDGNVLIAANGRVRQVSTVGIITTIAGNGTLAHSGDGGTGQGAQLSSPAGTVVDGAGNVYVADPGNQRVRKLTPAGVISTFAGDGTAGFAGDGGPAASAKLNNPFALALDGAGNLFIVERGNLRVRRVAAGSTTISTVAGNGLPGFSGDGGPATSASLGNPLAVAVDSAGTNLYVSDVANGRVRKITGGTITTFAGDGFVGDSGDGGPATSAEIVEPSGLAVDASGNLYIADSYNNRVRKVTPSGTISGFAGTPGTSGPTGGSFAGDGDLANAARLFYPTGVATGPGGIVLIADSVNHRIRKVAAGIITTIAGTGVAGFTGDGGPATTAQINNPNAVAVDASGTVFLTDKSRRVRRIGNGAPPVFTSSVPPGHAVVGTPLTPFTFATTANPAPTITVASGALPSGLTITSGVLGGTPTAAGTFSFAVRAANGVTPDATTPTRTIVVAPPGSRFSAVTPTRLLDTRTGTGGPTTPLGAGEVRPVVVTGGAIPADATAVVLNVTVTTPSTGGYLTVFPFGVTRPLASNLNFGPGTTIPNLVTVGVGTGGKVSIYNDTGTTQVIADVVGFYRVASGDKYTSVTPVRRLDSRTGTGGFTTPWPSNFTRSFTVTGTSVPADASAVVLNVTVTQGSANSYLTVFPAGVTQPLASNLNFDPGQTIPNLVIVGVGVGGANAGKVSIFNAAGTVHVLADVVGFYRAADGGLFTPVTPSRLMDTRSTLAVAPGESRGLLARGGITGLPPTATAVVMNVTATQPTGSSFLTVYPAGTTRPLASNLNYAPGQTIPNLVMIGVGTSGLAAGRVAFYNDTGTVHLITDVVGYMT
jgi:sugar lactone lactonase YvrE